MPSTTIELGSLPWCQVRCDSGYAAGPCSTVPSRWKRDPWQGQSKLGALWLSAIEQPRCGQLMAKTLTLPCWSLTTKPPKARSPPALSPPPSAIMKAELGLVGASNLTASPLASWSIGLVSDTFSAVFFWPLGGDGQR